MPLPYMRSGNDRPHGKAGCPPGGKPIVGADSISARGVRGAVGLPGTMRASSPTGVCYNTEVVFSRLAAGLPRFVGEGFIPPAGVCGAAGLPGTMQASSPTGVCYNAEVVVSRLAAGLPWFVGEGHGPSRGCSRRGGVRRDEGIPPYGHFIGSAYTGKSACFRRGNCGRGMPLPYTPSGNDRPHGKAGYPPGGKPIVGADSISARFAAPRGCPGRCEHRPLQGVAASPGSHFPGWPRARRGL